ncbi:MAG: TlpA family protein disulfide reductase [Oscillospiraceae bacterium]|nr:TlpA family protein disulfide reductase [Oscillospiraceae bacterium]
MKNKTTVFILALALVLLLGGAGVLYRQLGQTVPSEQLSVSDAQPRESGDAADAVPQQSGEGDAAAPQQSGDAAEAEAEQSAAPEQSAAAPDFTVYDAAGNAVRLSDFFGTPIVLNFWASWCGPCRSEMSDFHEKYLELDGAVQFLMINMTDGASETVETASAFIAEQGYTFPVFYDTSAEAGAAYGAYALPTTYFIDANGYAVAMATGAIDAETLQRGIDVITPQ